MARPKEGDFQKDLEIARNLSEKDMVSDIRKSLWDMAEKHGGKKAVKKAEADNIAPDRKDLMWSEENVLTFEEFCAHPDHMAFPMLSEKQLRVAQYLFGDDPKELFHTGRTTACLAWGKGSGKDTISALMICYLVYVLLCMRIPQEYFGYAKQSTLDLYNIAASKEQARDVFFEQMKQFILHWQWLKNRYNIVVSGRFLSMTNRDALEDLETKVVITTDAIMFPKRIRAFSGSSEAETLEGKNVIAFVLDETDAFKEDSLSRSADRIYRNVRTSASSRFGNKFKAFLLSYPRAKGGFILRMVEYAKRRLSFYGDVACTWEVKPRHMFMTDTFEFEGHEIPMDFYEDFELDPIGSKRAFLCDAPDAEALYIEDWSKVDMAAAGKRQALFRFKGIIRNNLIKKEITSFPFNPDPTIKYILTLDLGVKKDPTALTLMHRADDKIIMDFCTVWVPNPEKKIEVDLINVEDIIMKVKDIVPVQGVYTDRWNSALLIHRLRSKGLAAEPITLKFDDYEMFKRTLYAGNIDLLRNDRMMEEIKNLQLMSGKKVDHAHKLHNDMAVTVVMGVKMLTKSGKNNKSLSMMSEGDFIEDNLADTQRDNFYNQNEDDGGASGIMIDGIVI